MEIKSENIILAYNSADENGKRMLTALFGKEAVQAVTIRDNLPITERIKTFEDAINNLGENDILVKEFRIFCDTMTDENHFPSCDILAYFKLRIICAALNEGWKPQFTEEECRYYPWFWLYTKNEIEEMDEDEKQDRHLISTGDYQTESAGFASAASANAPSYSNAHFGSRLCLKNSELASYCGKQFINLWADFNLIRK